MGYRFRAFARDFLIAQRGVSHRFLSVREASCKRLPRRRLRQRYLSESHPSKLETT